MSIPLTLAEAISCSRTTSGYVDDKAGVWSLCVGNVPRVSDKGLLVEEARTNYIRNNSMQGAATGTPGTLPTNWGISFPTGITRVLVSKGIENGIDYVDIRLNGTTTNTNNVHLYWDTNISAATGQQIAISAFVKLVAGSWANVTAHRFTVNEYTSGAVFVTQSTSNFTPATGVLSRRVGLHTISGVTTANITAYISFAMPSGVALDFTLRIGWPQLERGKFATSPIRTTTAAVARAADMIEVINTPGIINPEQQTVFYEATPHMAAIAADPLDPMPLCWINGGFSNRILVKGDRITDDIGPLIVSEGVDYVEDYAVGKQPRTRYKFAMAAANNNVRSSMNGALGRVDTAVTMPRNKPTRARIGSAAWAPGHFASGYYHKLWFIPAREADAFLQSFTTQPETMNPRDKSAGVALSNGDLTVKTTVSATPQTIRSIRSHYTGKRYFEFKQDARNAPAEIAIGLATQLSTLEWWLGRETVERYSAAYFDNGQTWQNNTMTAIAQTLPVKHWLGVAVDFSAGKAWVRNATGWNGDPNAGTGNVFTFTPGLHLFAAMNVYTIGDQATINFGNRSFVYELPTGFGAWDEGPPYDPVTFNRNDAASPQIIFANDDLTILTNTLNQAAVARTTISHSTGKYYFEMRKDTEGEADSISFGVATQDVDLYEWLGDDVGSISFWGTGRLIKDNVDLGDLGRDYAVGEWIGIALDFNTGKFWMRNAAGWYGNPIEGSGQATTFTPNITYFAAGQLQTRGDQATANFGREVFAYELPYGFRPWDYVPVTFNPKDAAAEIILSNNDLTISTAATAATVAMPMARSSISRRIGKFYFEMKMDAQADPENISFGVAIESVSLNEWLGNEHGTIGIFDTGKVYQSFDTLGEAGLFDIGRPFTVAEWVGIAVDFDAGKIWFRDSTGWSGDPVVGTNPATTFPVRAVLFAASSIWSAGDQATANFGGGGGGFNYSLPNGYRGWDGS